MKLSHLITLLVFNCFWGGALSMMKGLEAYLSYGGIVTLRFGMAALFLLALWPLLPGKAPRGRDLAITFGMGCIVFVLGHRLQVLGNKLGTAGDSSVLMAAEPVVTALAAAFFLREHITRWRWIGFAFGIVGVLLLNGVWRSDFKLGSMAASIIFISSFLCEAGYSIIGKPLIERAGMLKVLAISLTLGTLVNLAIDGGTTIPAAASMPLRGWLMVLYLATLCTAIGYAVWLMVIREAEVNLAVMTVLLQPIAGIAVAALWLNEPLHIGQLWGSVAIVAGLIIGLRGEKKCVKE